MEFLFYVLSAFVAGLLATKPLERWLRTRQVREELPPARRALLKPEPLVQCSRCFRKVRPSEASFTFAKGWICKSHQQPAPMAFKAVA